MITLPLFKRKNGFHYTQVLRGLEACIYEQRVSESVKYFEVFKIRIRKGKALPGKKLETSEWFPNNESFGYWAWTFKNYEDALKKWKELEIR